MSSQAWDRRCGSCVLEISMAACIALSRAWSRSLIKGLALSPSGRLVLYSLGGMSWVGVVVLGESKNVCHARFLYALCIAAMSCCSSPRWFGFPGGINLSPCCSMAVCIGVRALSAML